MKLLTVLALFALVAAVAVAEETATEAPKKNVKMEDLMFYDVGHILELNGTAGFDHYILKDDRVWVLLFYTHWSGACKRFKQQYVDKSEKYFGYIQYAAIHADLDPILTAEYDVTHFPSIAVFHHNKTKVEQMFFQTPLRMEDVHKEALGVYQRAAKKEYSKRAQERHAERLKIEKKEFEKKEAKRKAEEAKQKVLDKKKRRAEKAAEIKAKNNPEETMKGYTGSATDGIFADEENNRVNHDGKTGKEKLNDRESTEGTKFGANIADSKHKFRLSEGGEDLMKSMDRTEEIMEKERQKKLREFEGVPEEEKKKRTYQRLVAGTFEYQEIEDPYAGWLHPISGSPGQFEQDIKKFWKDSPKIPHVIHLTELHEDAEVRSKSNYGMAEAEPRYMALALEFRERVIFGFGHLQKALAQWAVSEFGIDDRDVDTLIIVLDWQTDKEKIWIYPDVFGDANFYDVAHFIDHVIPRVSKQKYQHESRELPPTTPRPELEDQAVRVNVGKQYGFDLFDVRSEKMLRRYCTSQIGLCILCLYKEIFVHDRVHLLTSVAQFYASELSVVLVDYHTFPYMAEYFDLDDEDDMVIVALLNSRFKWAKSETFMEDNGEELDEWIAMVMGGAHEWEEIEDNQLPTLYKPDPNIIPESALLDNMQGKHNSWDYGGRRGSGKKMKGVHAQGLSRKVVDTDAHQKKGTSD